MVENILTEKQPQIITLNGKEYKVKPLNLNMMEQVEDKFDQPWDELIKGMRIKVLKYILWLCFKEYHPELTEGAIGELISSEILLDVYSKAMKG